MNRERYIFIGDGKGGGSYQSFTEQSARETYDECRRRIFMTQQKYRNRKRGVPYAAYVEIDGWRRLQQTLLDTFGNHVIYGPRS